MFAMQYEITLPKDYDMGIIHHRVASRASQMDVFHGLGLKAYCVQEQRDGSLVNQYAPFYIWNSLPAMNSFLYGPGFQGICTSFGRPAVRTWTGVAFRVGPAREGLALGASRRLTVLAPDTDPANAVHTASAFVRMRAEEADVHSVLLGVDTRTWELVMFTLWNRRPRVPDETIYSVLHLSSPEIDQLCSTDAVASTPILTSA